MKAISSSSHAVSAATILALVVVVLADVHNEAATRERFLVANDTEAPSPTPIQAPFGQIKYVGNDHNGFYYDRYPLGVCKGDCDSDLDCQEGLYCHQRSAYDEIPYCTGGGSSRETADFCAWNTSYPPPEPLPSLPVGAFRIKLYWEPGYLWQNETVEREWCMISDYDGYPGNGECHYGREVRDCRPDQVYIGSCLEGDPRQWFTLLDVGTKYTNDEDIYEVLIGTVSANATSAPEPQRCFIRQESEIFLADDCNPEDDRQRFFALTGSFTPSFVMGKSRFEISQYQGYTHDNCITNAHHPKSGEVIEFYICEFARQSEDSTSYWELML